MAVINGPMIGTENDDIITNDKAGVSIMIGGDGDDTYIVENILKSWSEIADGNYTLDENDIPGAIIPGSSARNAANFGNDKIIIKNINANDLILFFDVAIAENIYDKTSLPDDGLYIIKKSGINTVVSQYNKAMNATSEKAFINALPSANGIDIPFYFGDNNNIQENGTLGSNVGANYIKTIKTMDKNGVTKTLDVDGFISKIKPKVEEFLLLNDCKTASEVLFGGNVRLRNNLINIYKNATIDLLIEGTDGNDIIKGEIGNDEITAGKGNDTLYGGTGRNTFKFKKGDGQDTISSGKIAKDIYGNLLNTDALVFDNINYSDLKFSANGNNLVIKYGDNYEDSVTIVNYLKNPAASTITTIITKDDTKTLLDLVNNNQITLEIEGIDGKNNNLKGISFVSNEITGAKPELNSKGKLTGGNDKITGGNMGDILNGGEGIDVIHGGKGNDTIIGGTGDDKLYGDEGNNTFKFAAGDGQDTVYSGKIIKNPDGSLVNTDTLKFEGINYSDLKFSANGNNLVIKYGENYEDSVTIANYLKNPAANTITTIVTDDAIKSLPEMIEAGEITIVTKGIDGRNNNLKGVLNLANEITGAKPELNSRGKLTGGNDKITGGNQSDTLDGGEGNDVITGGKGDDTIIGGKGDDKLYGIEGNNTFVFKKGDGKDIVYSGKIVKNQDGSLVNSDTLQFADATEGDLRFTSFKNDLIIQYGTNYEDSVTIANYLYKMTKLNGESNSSVKEIEFMDGSKKTLQELLNGKSLVFEGNKDKNNSITGTNFDDIIYGVDKKIDGRNRVIAGNDIIKGGKGNDIIIGGTGDDKLYGIEGNNTFVFKKGDGQDTVFSGKIVKNTDGSLVNTDTLQFNNINVADIKLSSAGNDLIIKYSENDSVRISNYLKDPDASTVRNIKFKNDDGDTTCTVKELLAIKGPFVFDSSDAVKGAVRGTNADDIFYASAGNQKFYGGKGQNTYIFANGDGRDIIYYEGGTDIIDLSGNVTWHRPNSENTDNGAEGDNIVYYPNNSTIYGANINMEKMGNDLVLRYNKYRAENSNTGDPTSYDEIRIANYFKYGINNLPDIKLKVRTCENNDFTGNIEALPVKTYDLKDIVYNYIDYEGERRGRTIVGTFLNDEIDGSQGNDIIKGGKGNDLIFGNTGDDKLYGEEGNNLYVFKRGGYGYYNNDGEYEIALSDGNDTIYQTAGANANDTIDFTYESSQILLDETTGEKYRTGICLADLKIGVRGDDLVIRYSDNDSVTIAGYMKNFYAGNHDLNSVKTIRVNDKLVDTTNPQSEGFTAITIDIKDYVSNDPNFKAEILGALNAANTLNGSDNDDIIWGGNFNDTIYGKAGNDVIKGGKGDDKLYGEDGYNALYFKEGDGKDTIYSGAGSDVIVLDNALKGTVSYERSGNNLIVKYGSKGDNITISNYYTTIEPSVKGIVFADYNMPKTSFDALDVDFSHIVKETKDYFDYGELNWGIKSASMHTGGEGNDIVVTANSGYSYINAGDGNDTMYIQSKYTWAQGGEGDDTYVVANLKNAAFIDDNNGNNTVKILDNHNNAKILFNIKIDNEGNIVKDGSNDPHLFILNDASHKNALKGKKPGDGIEITGYDYNGKTIITNDGYQISTADVAELTQELAAWMNDNNFNGMNVFEAYGKCNSTQMQEVMAFMEKAEQKWQQIP